MELQKVRIYNFQKYLLVTKFRKTLLVLSLYLTVIFI